MSVSKNTLEECLIASTSSTLEVSKSIDLEHKGDIVSQSTNLSDYQKTESSCSDDNTENEKSI